MRDAVLIGPSFDQPRGHPVAVEVLPRRQLDAVEPLRRRHVAVEAGDDEPGREAVLGRQRLAVHRHGDERGATVEADLGREPGGEAVDRAADDLRRAGLHAGPVEQRRQRHALPRGVADEVAADLVGHARQRDELLDVGHGDELVVGERVRLVDHALDEQRPRPDVDLRDAERGVDAVEVVVRRDVRRQAGHVEAGRAERAADRTSGGGSTVSARADSTTSLVRTRRPSAAAPAAITASEPAPTRNVRRSSARHRSAAAEAQAARTASTMPAATASTAATTPIARLGLRVVEVRQQADDAEGGEPGDADPRPAHRRHAEQRTEGDRHDDDADDEGDLVVRAEQRDGEVLQRGGEAVDELRADGRDQRRRRPGEPAHQLADAERHPGGDGAGDRAGRRGVSPTPPRCRRDGPATARRRASTPSPGGGSSRPPGRPG